VPKLSVSIPANLKVPGRKPRPADPDAVAADPSAPASDPTDAGASTAFDTDEAQRTMPPKPLLLLLVGLVLALAVLLVVRGRGGDS
jgi:hypothetical protein